MRRITIAAFALLSGVAAPAMANHEAVDPGIDQRQHRLERRIEQGWRSGELTRREYRRLQYELRDIGRMEQFFRADGWVSPPERAQLHARLDHLAREIYREKHDGERRYEPHYEHGHWAYGEHGFTPYNRDYHPDRRF